MGLCFATLEKGNNSSLLAEATCTVKLYLHKDNGRKIRPGSFSLLKSSCHSATRIAPKIKRRQGRNIDVKSRRHFYCQ